MNEGLKILVIHGSPHQGQTHAATMNFLEELGKRVVIEARHMSLFREKLELCLGCGACVVQGEEKCPGKEGLLRIHSMMRESDAVIITTPVYALQVTALVKNFIERSSYVMHRPCYFGKWFMPLSTQYVGGDKDVEKYLSSVMRFWGFNVIPGLRLTMSWDKGKIGRKVVAAADRFLKAVKRTKFPAPSPMDLMMFRFRRSAMKGKSFPETFPRDAEYFQEKGWLESPYYYDVRLNPLLSAAGAGFDVLGRKIMK